jgi:hypothetical protein
LLSLQEFGIDIPRKKILVFLRFITSENPKPPFPNPKKGFLGISATIGHVQRTQNREAAGVRVRAKTISIIIISLGRCNSYPNPNPNRIVRK